MQRWPTTRRQAPAYAAMLAGRGDGVADFGARMRQDVHK